MPAPYRLHSAKNLGRKSWGRINLFVYLTPNVRLNALLEIIFIVPLGALKWIGIEPLCGGLVSVDGLILDRCFMERFLAHITLDALSAV